MNGGLANEPVRSRMVRDVVRLAGEALLAGVFVSVVLALAALIVATQARAAELSREASDSGPGQGALLIKSGTADIPAPLLATDVDIEVTGIVARAKVRQRFRNPSTQWQEGVYVFPLPEGAAVDHLDMQVGDRHIEGQIKEKSAARRTYDEAKREGRKATLVEATRPNVFTTTVANIGPDEEITITIEYQDTVKYDSGTFRVRFPMVLTPRYMPPAQLALASNAASPDADVATHAASVLPPSAAPVNPVSLHVSVDAGFALGRIESAYHKVRVEEAPGHRYAVVLDPDARTNRDFELAWKPDVDAAAGAALFMQRAQDAQYALLMLIPPPISSSAPRMPREVVFIIDTSGSMEGSSIRQAKTALDLALDRLQPGDRFNVIEFNSVTRPLFSAPLPVDLATLARAHAFVAKLRAGGGTEMKPALEAALTPDAAAGYVRQVIFLTDGAVGNESELFGLIMQRLGDRRLFTIGIGSAPNAWFMTKAAQYGRGTFTFIGNIDEVQAKMADLFTKLESPVLTDVTIAWPGVAETYPQRMPDLYAGEPIVVTAALGAVEGDVRVFARHAGETWQATLPLAPAGNARGIDVLWAHSKIDTLMDALHGGANEDDIRASVVEVALAHHLASRYTSLVAVDVTPSAPANTALARGFVRSNAPDGSGADAIIGELPRTATPATLHMLIGALALIVAAMLMVAARPRRFARP